MGSEPQKVQSPTKAKTGTRIWTLGLGQKIETICLFQGKYRPFVGQACQACTPKSMESFFYKRYAHMGFRNVLHITEEDSRTVLQRLGVLFLPTDEGSGTVSAAVLSVYTETFLSEGHSLLIFLESPPTSCSHPLSPSGRKWVQQIIGTLQSGAVADALIVPVGISYDSRLDCGYGGREVAPPSSAGSWKSFLSALCPWSNKLGCVRVDFAQPFSLQEYISSYKRMHLTSARPLQETLLPCILGFRNRMQDEAELETEPGAGADQEQALMDAFILHSLQAAVSCSAIMSSHIMAALLLYKYRAGVSLSRLLCDFPVLIEEILLHRFDVGFSGQRWDLVLHSLQILRRSVTLYSAPPIDIYVFCKESQAAVRELAYHSAALLPVFLYEALGACAVLALLSEVSCLGVVESLFAQDELIGKLMCLCSLLPRTLLLLPPCQSLYKVCQDVLDRLIQCGLIAMYEDPSAPPPCDTGRRRFVDKLMWRAMDEMTDSDSDHMEEEVKRYYKLGHSERHADSFIFLCRLLSPVLKTYERAALFLQENEEFVQDTEPAYVNMLHQYLLQKAKEDGSFECAEHSLAVCAVRTFVDLGVFKCHGSMLCLSETFLLQENCRRLIRFIQQFVYNG